MSDAYSSRGSSSSEDYPESVLDAIDKSSLPYYVLQVDQPGQLQQPGPIHTRHVFNLVAGMNQNAQDPASQNNIPDELIDPVIHQYQAVADRANAARPPSPWDGRMLTSIEYELRRARRNAHEAAQAELTAAQARLTALVEAQAATARHIHGPTPSEATNNDNNRRREPAQPRGQGRRAQRNATLHALGLCVHCQKPNIPGSRRKGCPDCRAKRAKLTLAWRDKTGRRPGPGRGGPGAQGRPPAPGAGAAMTVC